MRDFKLQHSFPSNMSNDVFREKRNAIETKGIYT